MNHTLLYAWFEVVVDEFGGDSWYRLLSCRIDVAEDYFVEHAQTVGKVLVEISCTGVQMRLEDSCYLTVLVQLA